MNTGTTPTMPDRNARFEHHIAPLIGQLYPAALRLTRNHADAQDLVQETCSRAFVSLQQLRDDASAKAWLHRILRNSYIDGYRQEIQAAQPHPVTFHEEWYTNANTLRAPPRSAEAEAIANMPDDDLQRALGKLSELSRRILFLADVEGYGYNEIAAMTGTARGTVASRLHRTRMRLRGMLRLARQVLALDFRLT